MTGDHTLSRHRDRYNVIHYVRRWRGTYYEARCMSFDDARVGVYTGEPGLVTCFWCAIGKVRGV